MERDRETQGQSAVSAPPPRASDRVEAPPPRRFARQPAPPSGAHLPPPHPAQAEDTLFTRSRAAQQAATLPPPPPPRAADLVAPASVPPPPPPPQPVGLPAMPPPIPAYRVPGMAPPRRRLIRRGPPWLGPALLAAVGVLLIGAGIGFGAHEIFAAKHHKKKAPSAVATPRNLTPTTPTIPRRPPVTPTGPATVSPGTATPGKKGKAPKSPAGTLAPSTPKPPSSIASWPSGKTAWTVVLTSATKRPAAESKARQALGRGIHAGVLNSSDYSSLRHGYWVAFAGQYGSSSAAAAAAHSYASQGFAGAYPRLVKP